MNFDEEIKEPEPEKEIKETEQEKTILEEATATIHMDNTISTSRNVKPIKHETSSKYYQSLSVLSTKTSQKLKSINSSPKLTSSNQPKSRQKQKLRTIDITCPSKPNLKTDNAFLTLYINTYASMHRTSNFNNKIENFRNRIEFRKLCVEQEIYPYIYEEPKPKLEEEKDIDRAARAKNPIEKLVNLVEQSVSLHKINPSRVKLLNEFKNKQEQKQKLPKIKIEPEQKDTLRDYHLSLVKLI